MEGIDISGTVLNTGVDYEPCQTKDFSTRMDGVFRSGTSFVLKFVVKTLGDRSTAPSRY